MRGMKRAGAMVVMWAWASASGQCERWLPVEGGAYSDGAPVFYRSEWITTDGPSVARWDGVRWAPLHPALANVQPRAYVPWRGELLISSDYDGLDGQTGSGMIAWDGEVPRVMPGLQGASRFLDLAEFEGELYCNMKAALGSTNSISRWDGAEWVAVPVIGTPSDVFVGIETWRGRLYAVHPGGVLYELENGTLVPNSARGDLLVAESVSGLDSVEAGLVVSCGTARFADGSQTLGVLLWDGTRFLSMDSGLDSNAPAPLVRHDGKLYAAGSFTRAGEDASHDFAWWDGSDWRGDGAAPVGEFRGYQSGGGNLAVAGSGFWTREAGVWTPLLSEALQGTFNSFASFRGDLHVAGSLTHAGGRLLNGIARREGFTWRPLGAGFDVPPAALATYRDELYAGGPFTTAGGQPMSGIARWDGAQWRAVGTGLTGRINEMVVYRDELFVAGVVRIDGGSAIDLARWNGSAWSTMPGNRTGGAGISKLGVVGESLYISGGFRSVDGVVFNRIGRWDGSWHPMGEGLPTAATCIGSFDGSVVVGAADFRENGEIVARGVAAWDGARWRPLGAPDAVAGNVRAVAEYNGSLYIVGRINAFGVSSIRKFDGTAWSSPLEDTGTATTLLVHENELFVGGVRGRADDVRMQGFGRIGCPCELPVVQSMTSSLTLCATGEGTLSVLASGGSLKYQWRRQGVPIVGAESPTLTLSGADARSVASYDCLVLNDCGSTRAGPIRVGRCLADFECDGFVDFFDVMAFHDAMTAGLPLADVNGDGLTDLRDLESFYGEFGLGCEPEDGPPGS